MGESSFSGWGIVIFLIILFWAFTGGGFGGWGNRNNNAAVDAAALAAMYNGGFGGGCNRTSNCEVERQGLITAAETNYRIIDEAQKSTQTISDQLRAQWDAAQGEKIFDLKMNQMAMQNQYNQQLLAKDATIERMTLSQTMTAQFNALAEEIRNIRSNMLTKPEVSGVGVACPSAAILNGLGVNYINRDSCGCGTGYSIG